MSRRRYLVLYLLGTLVAAAAGLLQDVPGYMDAEYYFLGGFRLATGHGFSEPVLWNYLDDPRSLPHPSHAYWMPLASLLVAAGLRLIPADPSLPLTGFAAGRLVFLLLAGLLPVLTAQLAHALSGKTSHATLAGLIAVFPIFYLPYLTTTDTFLIYMLLGGAFLWTVGWAFGTTGPPTGGRGAGSLVLGLLAGLMHLARADGALWVLIAGLAIALAQGDYGAEGSGRSSVSAVLRRLGPYWGLTLLGYLVIMGPWMWRNLTVFGTPLAPGGARAVWLTEYNELFAYPAEILTPARWMQSGVRHLIMVRLQAIGIVLVSALAVQGHVYLAPLVVWAVRIHWADLRVKVAASAWAITFLVMTLVFSEPGWRGGFFHSGAALQPLIWALAPSGLEAFIEWGVRRRDWRKKQAWGIFSFAILLFGALLTTFNARSRILGPGPEGNQWRQSTLNYQQVDQLLDGSGAGDGDVVLVNNPPGFYVATGRPAIAIPDGDLAPLFAVSERYSGRYLVLESNHPDGLDELYGHPEGVAGLRYLGSIADVQVYELASMASGADSLRQSSP